MTLYLLVVTEDGEDSYSLWKTEQAAKSERTYLTRCMGISMYATYIIPLEVGE